MFSPTHSSVSSGSTDCCTRWMKTSKVGQLLVAVRHEREHQFLALGGPDELIVEAAGNPALADFVQPVVGIESGNRFVIAARFEIDRDLIAELDRAVNIGQRGRAAQFGVDRLVDVVVAGGDGWHLDPQAAIAGHGDLGAHLAGGIEADRPALLATGDGDLGGGDQVDVVLAHGLGQVVRHAVA